MVKRKQWQLPALQEHNNQLIRRKTERRPRTWVSEWVKTTRERERERERCKVRGCTHDGEKEKARKKARRELENKRGEWNTQQQTKIEKKERKREREQGSKREQSKETDRWESTSRRRATTGWPRRQRLVSISFFLNYDRFTIAASSTFPKLYVGISTCSTHFPGRCRSKASWWLAIFLFHVYINSDTEIWRQRQLA